MQRNLKSIIVIVVLIVLGLLVLRRPLSSPPQTTSNIDEAAITARVEEFGKKLKEVSLLQDKDALKAQIKLVYGSFLTPELLAAWLRDPSQALGRSVSSPWPDRIQAVEVTKESDSYKVEGNVIEVTSNTPLEPAAVYPVTLKMVRSGESWLIAQVVKGSYSELPRRITVEGTWECLPHKDTSGPQTLECAFGLKTDKGLHYALDLNLLEVYPVDFPTGERVRAEGVFMPANQLDSDRWQKYPIEGILSVTSIHKI
ncbi:hypothetical protein KW785_02405 [Candidatus Parcubacteria bacterium]|nr:hypothetical protein [Candidatus Parcubacteria bacterium]